MKVLRELANNHELGITQLSDLVGLPKSTVFRLVRTLLDEQLVEQNPDSRKYRLGLVALVIGSAAYRHTDLGNEVVPYLMRLSRRMPGVVRLGIYDHGYVLYLYKTPDNKDTVTYSGFGRRVPAYCTAIGKVLLAYQPITECEQVLSGPLTRLTANTVVESQHRVGSRSLS